MDSGQNHPLLLPSLPGILGCLQASALQSSLPFLLTDWGPMLTLDFSSLNPKMEVIPGGCQEGSREKPRKSMEPRACTLQSPRNTRPPIAAQPQLEAPMM